MSRKNTLVVLVGVPGSGKTTFAKLLKNGGMVHVSTDEIREEILGSASDQSQGDKVFAIAYKRMQDAGKEKKDCVFDATSRTVKDRKVLIDKAKGYFDFVICYYSNTDLQTCLKRNQERERPVPQEVIERMWRQLQKPTLSEGFDYVSSFENAEMLA